MPGTAPGPRFSIRSPRAAAHVLYHPFELGLGRAYVSGEIEVDDLDAVVDIVREWQPPEFDRATKARLALAAIQAAGLEKPPQRPEAELVPNGRRYTISRDRRSVRHHYDLPPEFFALFLDESMTYSCAIFSRGATTLEEAQEAKLELVCTKLGLKEGQRILDVGCGWGSFALHAAQRHGVHVTGITLSPPQAEMARARAAEAGTCRPHRHPRAGLARPDRRAVRRDRLDRDGRARRRGLHRRLRAAPARTAQARRARCSTTASRGWSSAIRAAGRSRSATSSPTARPCTSRGSCWPASAPAS